MKKPLVSVICTNFNKGEWIKDAIEGFLMQITEFNFEIILIDDKSTDNSIDILRDYARKYPKKIRLFENKQNMGITKTWKKICREAKGKYIARCDGDDFWIDKYKLQKQVDLLEKDDDSKWCNSDFKTINEEGDTICEKSFASGFINLPKDFDEMLTTLGFTMASTWLVEADLMRDINKTLPDDAIDDTFNIQLELFLRTKLTHLQDTTTVYRINQNSDSHPEDYSKIEQRYKKLLITQLSYSDKISKNNRLSVINSLLEKDCQMYTTNHILADENKKLHSSINSLELKLVEYEDSIFIKLRNKIIGIKNKLKR